MRKIKLSLAGLAFAFAIGIAVTQKVNANAVGENECSSAPGIPADMPLPDPSCNQGDDVFCCYVPLQSEEIRKPEQ